MMNLTEIKSPTLLLNSEIAKSNIRRMVEKCRLENISFRPHFKTHQSIRVGQWFREAGVTTITVSSVRMAFYFQKAGWNDITIAFPYNPREHQMIENLAGSIKLTITIPGIESARILASKTDCDIDVMIKIDTGYNRSGVQWDNFNEVSDIIDLLAAHRHVTVKGFLTHSGDTYKATGLSEIESIYSESVNRLNFLRDFMNNDALIISVGDTPSSSITGHFGKVNELRPGNFVFYDLMQYSAGVCSFEEIAVAMACPVVDIRSDNGTMVIYGGSVHLSKEQSTVEGKSVYGMAVRLSEDGWEKFSESFYLTSLSQEHGVITAPHGILDQFKPGDLIGIIPVHSCLAANLAGGYLLTDGAVADHMNEKKTLFMSLKEIRKLGDPVLRKIASPVKHEELAELMPQFEKMWDLIIEFRNRYKRGRAIAAPQIGILKRVICLNTDHKYVLINPELTSVSDEMMEIWDDCMSFPNLFVKVNRYKSLTLSFYDINWELNEWHLTGDMAELIQHEYDHLDGIMAVDRVIDKNSFRWVED